MDKLPDRFRCEGCGRVVGADEVEAHKQIHGLVTNIGPDREKPVTVTQFVVEMLNKEGTWTRARGPYDAGTDMLPVQQEVIDTMRLYNNMNGRYVRVRTTTITTTRTPGQEVEL